MKRILGILLFIVTANTLFAQGRRDTLHVQGGLGGGGISKLGSPTYGLIRVNDSTYIIDHSLIDSITSLVPTTGGSGGRFTTNLYGIILDSATTNLYKIKADTVVTAKLRDTKLNTLTDSLLAHNTRINSKQDSLNWYMPERYGAVGDGTTNDAAAFTAMIAAMPNRGKVHLSSKTYLINTTVTVNKSITFEGNGTGDAALGIPAATLIKSSVGGITVFNVTEDHCEFSDIAFQNTGAQTSGAAIAFNGNTRTSSYIYSFYIDKVCVNDFFNGIEATNALHWGISNCQFRGNKNYTIQVACSSLPDGGDSYITGCNFASATGVGGSFAAIYQTSSGGLKVSNSKFNAGAGTFVRQIYSHIDQPTVDLLVTGNSFENYKQNAIQVDKTGSGTFGLVSIVANEFAGGSNVGGDIIISGINAVSITANAFAKGGVDTAIKMNTVNQLSLLNTYNGYSSPVTLTSCTNIFQASNQGVDVANNASNGGASYQVESDQGAGYLVAWGSAVGVPGISNITGLVNSVSRGLIISSDGSAGSGGNRWGAIRGGGYDSLANRLYFDKSGIGISKGYYFNPSLPPVSQLTFQPPTSSAGTGQLVLLSGTPPTTPVAGMLNNNNGLLVYDSSTSKRDTLETRSDARNRFRLSSDTSGNGGTVSIYQHNKSIDSVKSLMAHNVLVSNTQIVNTGNLTENTIYTGTIPANSIGIDGALHFIYTLTATNNVDVKTLKVKINGTTIATLALTGSAWTSGYTIIHNRHSLTSQTSGSGASAANSSFASATGGGASATSFDTGTNLTVTVTAQLSTTTSNALNLETFEIIAFP